MKNPTKRKIGVLGGAFNPPHFGHLLPAMEVIERVGLQQVLFLPSGEHPLKKNSIIAANHRYAMTKAAIDQTPQFAISDLDVKRAGTSYSVDTLAELANRYPDHELAFMVGSDILGELHLWKSWHKILDNAHMLMMVRPGIDVDLNSPIVDKNVVEFLVNNRVENPEQLDAASGGSYKFIQIPVTPVDISATKVRAMVKNGINYDKYTPAGVVKYIIEHRLYLT
ncbi:MAG: nicotinate (nicotinamide) nucleotide adenylyltransferase [Magnetococcales bacterium]|nr:nicotinate (nicotinamide) nucleotide adenylyltransferase [Magnetococcales bacterium]